MLLVMILYLAILSSIIAEETTDTYLDPDFCYADESCWPTDELQTFATNNPTLSLVLPDDSDWNEATKLVLNTRFSEKEPGAVIYATTTADIQAVVTFSMEYNLRLMIISSGHEFTGRNIEEGCLLLSVSRIASISTDLSCSENTAGCMTVGPGVLWIAAYRAADAVGRIVVGGSEPTVSVTGWMLGGGHAPVSPMLGLGVDQVLELEMVTADSSVVTMNKDGITTINRYGNVSSSNETDLFWAVRGGGGGTFGVVTSIKYKLHMPPSEFNRILCTIASKTQSQVNLLKKVHQNIRATMANLPKEFGGYIISGNPLTYSYILLSVLHWGPQSDNKEHFDEILLKARTAEGFPGSCTVNRYETFLEYENTISNTTHAFSFLGGAFIPKDGYTDDLINVHAKAYGRATRSGIFLTHTWILLGGQTEDDSSGATAINTAFRTCRWSLAWGTGWDPERSKGNAHKRLIADMKKDTVKVGVDAGQYYSETNTYGGNSKLPPGAWQNEYFPTTYNRLLGIKKKYDPNNHFTCAQCVGSSAGRLIAGMFSLSIVKVYQIL